MLEVLRQLLSTSMQYIAFNDKITFVLISGLLTSKNEEYAFNMCFEVCVFIIKVSAKLLQTSTSNRLKFAQQRFLFRWAKATSSKVFHTGIFEILHLWCHSATFLIGWLGSSCYIFLLYVSIFNGAHLFHPAIILNQVLLAIFAF